MRQVPQSILRREDIRQLSGIYTVFRKVRRYLTVCESRWHREYYSNYSSLTERYISVKDFYISEEKHVTYQAMAGFKQITKTSPIIQ